MSTIRLNNIHFHALHGVLPAEAIVGNDYLINLKIETDTTKAELEDDLDGTINYADVYSIVEKEMQTPSKLIEHVARRIQDSIIKAYPQIEVLETEVAKLRPPVRGVVESASITLTYKK